MSMEKARPLKRERIPHLFVFYSAVAGAGVAINPWCHGAEVIGRGDARG